MNYTLNCTKIPGTVLDRCDYGNATGNAFLNRIFFLDDSIMLGQVRVISGVESSTMQNWVKRGWLPNTVNRRYSKEHLSRILIINMLRSVMHLEEIDHLLRYVNGDMKTSEDDIIAESDLYHLICLCIDSIAERAEADAARIQEIAAIHTAQISKGGADVQSRICHALCVILPAFFASLVLEDVKNGYKELKK